MPDGLIPTTTKARRRRNTEVVAVGRYKDALETLGIRRTGRHLEIIEAIRQAPRPSREAERRIAALEAKTAGLLIKETDRPSVDDLLNHQVARGPMDPVARSYLDRQVKRMEDGGVTWEDLEDIVITLGRFLNYSGPGGHGWVNHSGRMAAAVAGACHTIDLGHPRSVGRQPRPAKVHLDCLLGTPIYTGQKHV